MYECLRCGKKPLLLVEFDADGKKRWKCGNCGLKTYNPTHYHKMRHDMFVVECAVWLWMCKGLTLRAVAMVLKRELDVDVSYSRISRWVNGGVAETGYGER